MPATYFKCIAQDKDGRRTTQILRGDDVGGVVSQLKQQGLLPLKVYATHTPQSLSFFSQSKVSTKELVVFTRQLAATLGSGLILTESLETIAEDLENIYFQEVILAVSKDIRGGGDFSNALSRYPKIFPTTYVAIIKSGEATGRLHLTLSNVADYLEKAERIREKVKGAMSYPLFILGFSFAIILLMMFFLIPKFKEIYAGAGSKLPLVTQVLIDISDFSTHNWLLLLILSIVTVSLVIYFLKKPEMKARIDELKLNIPVLGRAVVHKSMISNFCRTFGFLISSGVEMSRSLDIVAEVVGHEKMKGIIKDIRNRVISGGALSQTIREHKIFPRLVPKMVGVGEKSGRLSDMLTRTAEYYENEVENTIQNLMVLIEPALIVSVGCIVGLIVVALYLPIFKASSLVK